MTVKLAGLICNDSIWDQDSYLGAGRFAGELTQLLTKNLLFFHRDILLAEEDDATL